MHESKTLPANTDFSLLHASTCLSMTRFINGHHCPKLAQQIVHQLNRLLSHPGLNQLPDSRDMYLQMLDHWQKIAHQLLEQKNTGTHAVVYH